MVNAIFRKMWTSLGGEDIGPVGELPARPLCEKAMCSGYSPNRRIGQSNRRMVLRIFDSAWDDPFCIHLSTSSIGSGSILVAWGLWSATSFHKVPQSGPADPILSRSYPCGY